jgi:hypothetical protein
MISKAKDISDEMDAEIETRLSQTADQQRLLSDFFLGKVGSVGQHAISAESAISAIPAFSDLRTHRRSALNENTEEVAQTAAE